MKLEWIKVRPDMYVMKVYRGWIVKHVSGLNHSLVFFPDPQHDMNWGVE